MSRLNIVAGVVFLLGLLWVFTMGTEKRQALQGKVLSWFSPIYRAEERIRENREISEQSQKDPVVLAEQIQNMETELAFLRVEADRVTELRGENEELRGMLNFVQRSYSDLLPARVIKRDPSNWWSTLIIDKGSLDGVATDAPVRSELGLVGKTAELENHSSKILLLTDEQCWVAAKVQGIPHPGMVRGQRGNGPGSNLLRLQFLDKSIEIPQGRKVYTRGVEGVFPPNILIGTVIQFIPGDIDAEAIVEPVVDFSSVKNVFVIVKEEREARAIPVEGEAPVPVP